MTNDKQKAFFNLAHNLATEFAGTALLAGMVLFEIQDNTIRARDSENFQFVELLSSLGITEPLAIQRVSAILDLIVSNAETSGVIDSEFAEEFRSKYIRSVPHE